MVNCGYERHAVRRPLQSLALGAAILRDGFSGFQRSLITDRSMNRDVTHLRNSGRALWLIHRTWGLNQPEGSRKRAHNSATMSPLAYICGIHREVSGGEEGAGGSSEWKCVLYTAAKSESLLTEAADGDVASWSSWWELSKQPLKEPKPHFAPPAGTTSADIYDKMNLWCGEKKQLHRAGPENKVHIQLKKKLQSFLFLCWCLTSEKCPISHCSHSDSHRHTSSTTARPGVYMQVQIKMKTKWVGFFFKWTLSVLGCELINHSPDVSRCVQMWRWMAEKLNSSNWKWVCESVSHREKNCWRIWWKMRKKGKNWKTNRCRQMMMNRMWHHSLMC